MDTIRTLINGALPPAGNRICLNSGSESTIGDLFQGRHLQWVDSGTSALALALLDIRERSPEHKSPEVIIPAYCCPDLVSAALFAGFTPVLADLAIDSCHPDISLLEHLVTDRTLAVIAINFLGLPPPLKEIHDAVQDREQIAIVMDCAQWFPEDETSAKVNVDYLTFSFGRGKAVNLLGGGLLVTANPVIPHYKTISDSNVNAWIYAAKCSAYNLLLNPMLYQMLDRNPLLKLGETRYHELERLTAMVPWQQRRVTTNVQIYQNHERAAERAFRKKLNGANTLAGVLGRSPQKLLRYPLLLPTEAHRNKLLEELKAAGLGATSLYGDALPALPDVPVKALKIGQTEQAQLFARRLLTLPVHEGIQQRHWLQIIDQVRLSLR